MARWFKLEIYSNRFKTKLMYFKLKNKAMSIALQNNLKLFQIVPLELHRNTLLAFSRRRRRPVVASSLLLLSRTRAV